MTDPPPVPRDIESLADDRDHPVRFRLGYRPELDGIRAVAVVAIVAGHLFWFFPRLAQDLGGFFLGVDIFFALSGFLLTGLLIEERERNGRFSFGGFYVRRAFRLLPSLVVMLTTFVVFTVVTDGEVRKALRSSLFALFYVANFASAHDPAGFAVQLDPTWSLSVEEQYYLIFFPLLVLLLARVRSTRTVLWVLGAAIAAVAAWRFALTLSPGVDLHAVYIRTDTRADALLVGPFAAFLVYGGFRRGRVFKILTVVASVFVAVMIATSSQNDLWVFRWALLPVDVSVMIVILAITLSQNRVRALLSSAPVVWVGRISYELYIWHYAIFFTVATRMGASGMTAGFAVVVSVAVAAATHRFVARPFLDRRRRSAVALRGASGSP